jgi:chitinase
MLSKSLRALSGRSSDVEAWDALFRYFNEKHSKGSVGYRAGEKIAIKFNSTQKTYQAASISIVSRHGKYPAGTPASLLKPGNSFC